MTEEVIPTYLCRKIKTYVHGEKMEDLAGRIIVHCDFYEDYMHSNNRNTCFFEMPKYTKCLVKLAVQKESKIRFRLRSKKHLQGLSSQVSH